MSAGMTFLWVVLALTGGAFLGLLAWLLVIKYKERRKPKDAMHLWNFNTKLADGCAEGVVTTVKKGPNNMVRVYFDPKDVDPDGDQVGSQKDLIIPQHYLHIFPRGELSKEKSIALIVPDNPAELPEKFKDTAFGNALTRESNVKGDRKLYEEIMETALTRTKAHLREIGRGEVSEENWTSFKKLLIDDIKASIMAHREKDSRRDYYNPRRGI